MTDATEITNIVFSALSDRKGFDDWFDQIDQELQTEIKAEIAEAIAALRAQPAGWIAVSERLPKPWDAVMVHPRPNEYVNEAYLNHKGAWMYSEYVTDFGDQDYPCVVTHWMPLPPPPGQERAQPDHSELVAKLQDLVDNGWIEGCKTTTRDIEEAILALT